MLLVGEIVQVKEIMLLLHPLEKMTRDICGDKFITISKVITMLRYVLDQYYSKLNPFLLGQKTALLSEISKRFGQIKKSNLLATATILEQRFKQLHFKDASAYTSTINILSKKLL